MTVTYICSVVPKLFNVACWKSWVEPGDEAIIISVSLGGLYQSGAEWWTYCIEHALSMEVLSIHTFWWQCEVEWIELKFMGQNRAKKLFSTTIHKMHRLSIHGKFTHKHCNFIEYNYTTKIFHYMVYVYGNGHQCKWTNISSRWINSYGEAKRSVVQGSLIVNMLLLLINSLTHLSYSYINNIQTAKHYHNKLLL